MLTGRIKIIAVPLYLNIVDVGVVWCVTAENCVNDIDITVVESASGKEKLCYRFAFRPFGSNETIGFHCMSRIIGRVLKIQNRGEEERALTLCGVRVYGTLRNATIESSSNRCNY